MSTFPIKPVAPVTRTPFPVKNMGTLTSPDVDDVEEMVRVLWRREGDAWRAGEAAGLRQRWGENRCGIEEDGDNGQGGTADLAAGGGRGWTTAS